MIDTIAMIIIAICFTTYLAIDRICETEEIKAVTESEKDIDDEDE